METKIEIEDAEIINDNVNDSEPAQDEVNTVSIDDFKNFIQDDDEEEDEEDEDEPKKQQEPAEQEPETIPVLSSEVSADAFVEFLEFLVELVYSLTIFKDHEIPDEYEVFTKRDKKNMKKVWSHFFDKNPQIVKFVNPAVSMGFVTLTVLLSSFRRARKLKKELQKQKESIFADDIVVTTPSASATAQKKGRGRPKKIAS